MSPLLPLPSSQSPECARQHDVGMMTTIEIWLTGLTEGTDQNDTTPNRIVANEVGKPRIAVNQSTFSNRVLGIMGRCTAHKTMSQGIARSNEHIGSGKFVCRPAWCSLQRGQRPSIIGSSEPCDSQHGWQHHATSSSEHFFRETGSNDALLGCRNLEFEMQPGIFGTLVLERHSSQSTSQTPRVNVDVFLDKRKKTPCELPQAS